MAEDEETWQDIFEMLALVDGLIPGRARYPRFERYWLAVLVNPTGVLPISGKVPAKNGIVYGMGSYTRDAPKC